MNDINGLCIGGKFYAVSNRGCKGCAFKDKYKDMVVDCNPICERVCTPSRRFGFKFSKQLTERLNKT